MPRATGQIDERKSEAILAAASTLFAERGGTASMDEIARRAGVSKQTLYNRFSSKLEVARAVANARSDAITAPLRTDGDVETVLSALALAIQTKVCAANKAESLRGVALMAPSDPEMARAIYDGGPAESLRRLAVWLAEQDRRGRLRVPDPAAAAEMFNGMVVGHGHLRMMLAVPHRPVSEETSAEIARRFIRAFAP